ncbi:MAG: NACHT domain-containing protein [Oscillatoriaceae cyanobacterium Prado104]|jgi:predicted NACHT family NTPase|nr:NACHT domain-containing protein [Oscillatoriaceae cyanobacterium Prado104]
MECNAGNLQAHRIPVLIKLRDFVEDGREVAYSLEGYLKQCWRLSDAETQLIFDRGRSLVLLDGLDEVTGEDGKNIAKEIKRFARIYPQVQVIITCRTQSQESRFERFDYVEVADFNESQVQSFSEHWFKTVMGDESGGLAKAREFLEKLFLEANKPIRELTITPILLSLTCAVFHQTGKFYSKHSKLYEEGLELLLEQWDKSREIDRDEIYRDLSVERKLELLSFLAVKKFEQEQYVLFEQAEIEGYIAEFLEIGPRDSRSVLKAMEAQHGLLIERSQKVWSFSHLTFQEYLVAKHFIGCKDWDSLAKQITNPRHWREVYLLIFSFINEESLHDLLILIKQKIDCLIKKEKKLDEFLKWVENKANMIVDKPYEEVVIKALYFELELNRNYGLELALDINRTFGILNPYVDFKFPLTYKLNDSTDDFYFMLDNYEFSIDNHLCQTLFFNPAINPDFADELMLPIGAHNNFYGALHLAAYVDVELQNQMQALSYKFPDCFVEDAEQWWKEQGNSWTEQLRNLAIKHRNIGYNWQFSDEEMVFIQLYHTANQLLVDCLSVENVNVAIREEIKKTLLLPSAEIENDELRIYARKTCDRCD